MTSWAVVSTGMRRLAAMLAVVLFAACGSGSGPPPASAPSTSAATGHDGSAVPCLDGSGRSYRAELPEGTYGSGDALYRGPLTLTWRVADGPFFEAPNGTHGDDPGCSQASLGRGWDLTATSSGTNAQGSAVRCEYAGRYTRTGMAVGMSLDGNCDITEAGANGTDRAIDDATHEERTATLSDCTGPVALANCALDDVAYEASDG